MDVAVLGHSQPWWMRGRDDAGERQGRRLDRECRCRLGPCADEDYLRRSGRALPEFRWWHQRVWRQLRRVRPCPGARRPRTAAAASVRTDSMNPAEFANIAQA